MLFYCFLNTFFKMESGYKCLYLHHKFRFSIIVVFDILEAILFIDINICLYNIPHFAVQHKLKINK